VTYCKLFYQKKQIKKERIVLFADVVNVLYNMGMVGIKKAPEQV